MSFKRVDGLLIFPEEYNYSYEGHGFIMGGSTIEEKDRLYHIIEHNPLLNDRFDIGITLERRTCSVCEDIIYK